MANRGKLLCVSAAVLVLLIGQVAADVAPPSSKCYKKGNSSPIQTCETTLCQGNGELHSGRRADGCSEHSYA